MSSPASSSPATKPRASTPILSYVVNILNKGGLPGSLANWGDLRIKVILFLMTIVGVILVDRWGRKSLLMLGSGGIVVSLAAAGVLFLIAEGDRTDYRDAFQAMVEDDALTRRDGRRRACWPTASASRGRRRASHGVDARLCLRPVHQRADPPHRRCW